MDRTEGITREDLRDLPRWGRVAFAVRWGRRVQPLLVRFCPDLSDEFHEAFDRALTLAEQSCTRAQAVEGLDEATEQAERQARAATQGGAPGQPAPLPPALRYAVCHAAAAAARAAQAAGQGDDDASAAAAIDAYKEAPAAGRDAQAITDAVLSYDFLLLQRAAQQGQLTNATAVGPQFFGLERELVTYARELNSLLTDHAGEFALIRGDEVVSCWQTYEDAVQAGYMTCGLQPFLVRQVRASDGRYFFPERLGQSCLT